MAKNKQQIKFEADISNLKTNIKNAQKSITSLNNELKLNQAQLKENNESTDLLSKRIEILKDKYEKQKEVVDNTRKSYEKAVEIFGENSNEAENLKNKLLQAETAEQNIKNEINKTNKELEIQNNKLINLNKELEIQNNKLINLSKKWQESGETLKNYGDKIESVGNKLSVASGLVAGAGIISIKSAIETETSIQQIENIYGEASNTIKDFAENTALSFNMSKSEAYKYSQVFGNLIQSITDDQVENARYTQELLKASSIIASSTGRSMEDVMDRIRSGLLGNTEAIEDLGINVNVSLLESTEAFKRFAGDKSWLQLDFQTQQQIRLFAILEQTTKKYGDEVQQNTASSIQQLTAKTKNLTNDLGKKLLPIANDVLEQVNDLVSGFENLSDEEKENIIKIGGLIAVAGPLVKLAGTSIKTIGSVTKGIGTLTGAIGVLTKGSDGATDSSKNLANILKKSFSPTGIAVAAVVGGFSIMTTQISKATEESRKQAEEAEKTAEKIREEKEAVDELRTSIDNNVQIELTHIERTKELWAELQKITDENGKIKEGYESRAKVITGQLSEALGTEISITDNIINKYKELQDEIDLLILKKQTEAVLSGSEEKYNQAITNREQKTQELITQEEKLNTLLAERENAYNNLSEVDKKVVDGVDPLSLTYQEQISQNLSAQLNVQEKDKAIKQTEDSIKNLRNEINNYTRDIETHQYKLELAAEETPEALQEIVDMTGKTYMEGGKIVETTYERQIKAQQIYLNDAKTLNEEAVENNDEAQKSMTQSTINEANRRLNALTDELIGMTSTTNENSEDVKNAWRALATDSYDIYNEKVSKLPMLTQIKIEEMTGVAVTKAPEFAITMEYIAQLGVDALDKSADFKAKALESLNEYLAGLTDEEKRKLLQQAGIENIDLVMQELEKGNLSEEKGREILTGLYNGLEDKEFKANLFGAATTLAGQLSSLLTIKPTIATVAGISALKASLPGHKDGLDYVPYDNYVARLHKGERVLTAEENKDYMSGNIENKVNNRNIVVQFYPQHITEQELKRAEDYIAKKWGMQW